MKYEKGRWLREPLSLFLILGIGLLGVFTATVAGVFIENKIMEDKGLRVGEVKQHQVDGRQGAQRIVKPHRPMEAAAPTCDTIKHPKIGCDTALFQIRTHETDTFPITQKTLSALPTDCSHTSMGVLTDPDGSLA